MTCEFLAVIHLAFKVHILLGPLNSTWKKVPVYDKILPTPLLLIWMFLKKKRHSFPLLLLSHHFYLHVIFPTSSRLLLFLCIAGSLH